jgi:hypothetical protein
MIVRIHTESVEKQANGEFSFRPLRPVILVRDFSHG